MGDEKKLAKKEGNSWCIFGCGIINFTIDFDLKNIVTLLQSFGKMQE